MYFSFPVAFTMCPFEFQSRCAFSFPILVFQKMINVFILLTLAVVINTVGVIRILPINICRPAVDEHCSLACNDVPYGVIYPFHIPYNIFINDLTLTNRCPVPANSLLSLSIPCFHT